MLAGLLAGPTMALGLTLSMPMAASAADCNGTTISDGAKCAQGDGQSSNLFTGDNPIFKTITNAALFLIGAISVLMLIYGGIRYTISGGNDKDVVAAKNTILYAIIGIIVALLAYAIVNWVLGTLIAG